MEPLGQNTIKPGPPPTRIVMLQWGDNETATGPVKVGLRTLAASQQWGDWGFDEVAIDYNHNTVPGHPSYQGEPCAIAAMSAVRCVPGVGIVFEPVVWTAEGIRQRGNYKDYSPAVKLDNEGEVIFVHSGALARNGAVKGLHALSSSAYSRTLDSKISTFMASPQSKSHPFTSAELAIMKRLGITPEQWIKHNAPSPIRSLSATPVQRFDPGSSVDGALLRSTFSLPPTSTDDQVNDFLEKFQAVVQIRAKDESQSEGEEPDLLTRLQQILNLPPTAGKPEIIAALRLPPNVSREALHEAILKLLSTDDAAKNNGEEENSLGAQIRAFAAGHPAPCSSARLTPTQREVNRALGISDETWIRHNPA